MLNSKALTDRLDTLTEKISHLNERLDKKYEYIAALEARLSSVEADLDQLEQYSIKQIYYSSVSPIREGGRHHRQAAVHCERDNGSHTCHCERRRSDKSSARTARARCRRANTTTASDRQICDDPRARRGHPCETPLAGKRRWTDGVRQRKPDTSAGGVSQEVETTEEVKQPRTVGPSKEKL